MKLDGSAILAAFMVSSVGLGLFMYGRKMGRFPQLVMGIVLLVYPYFVPSAPLTLMIAAVLLVALWLSLRAGW